MNRLPVAFTIIFASLYIVYGLKTLEEATFEIHIGNCSRALLRERVYFDHVYLKAIPIYVRSHDAKWAGDQSIYCINVDSLKEKGKGSTAEITEGGLKHHFVTIALKSGRGHGLEYNVSIYAK